MESQQLSWIVSFIWGNAMIDQDHADACKEYGKPSLRWPSLSNTQVTERIPAEQKKLKMSSKALFQI